MLNWDSVSNGNIPLLVVVSISVLGQQAISAYFIEEICKFIIAPKLGDYLSILSIVARATYATIAFTEILLAFVLVLLLRSRRSGLKHSDTLLDKLVRYAISSGSVTALNATAATISISAFPDSFLHFLFGSLKAKCKQAYFYTLFWYVDKNLIVYANAMLALWDLVMSSLFL